MASRELTNLSISLAGGTPDTGNAVNSNYRSLGSPENASSPTDKLNDTLNRTLQDTANSLSKGTGKQEKTIMEQFAARAGLVKEGGEAERKLNESNFADRIAGQLDENANSYIQAQEGRSGFGTKTAAVKYMEDTGSKRVRQLEKDRDSLLLQSKVLEASRLDDLIAKEQEAITTARTNWLSDLLSLGQESRNISAEERAKAEEERTALSFETPEQERNADLLVEQRGALFEDELLTKQSVRDLAVSAPDAGITTTDTYDEAVTKYRNSETYKRNERAGELELQQIQASIDNTRSLTNNRGRSTGGGSTGDTVLDGAKSDLDIVAGNAMNLIKSENGKEAFAETLKNARTDADKINAISSVVLANSPAEVKTDFINQSAGIKEIDEALFVLDQGIQTGALQATQQYLFNVVGKDFDPNLAAINAHITAAIQPYRASITGAAWGSQEDAEYKNLFGSTKYEPEELRSRLLRVKGILQRKSVNALGTQVSPFGSYDIFSGVYDEESGGSTPSDEFSVSDEDF